MATIFEEIQHFRLDVAHVMDGLKFLPDKSIHSVLTSPPYYFLRNYGTFPQVWGGKPECNHAWKEVTELGRTGKVKCPTYHECPCGAWRGELGLEPYIELYIEHMVLVMKEIYRVLRDDGTVFFNIGDSSNADMRRPLRPGKELTPKDSTLIPMRLALAFQENGWVVRQSIIWAKGGANCPDCGTRVEKGDAKPAPVRSKLVPSHEYVFLLSKSSDYYFDYVGIQEKDGVNRRDVLFFPTTRYSGAHYAVMSEKLSDFCVLAGTPPTVCGECLAPYIRQVEGRHESAAERRERIRGKTSEGIAPRHDGGSLQQGIHIGTFPKKTIGWQKSCECPTTATNSGIVLDPFSGSGTTGASALKQNKRYIGIDVDPRNKELAIARFNKILEEKQNESNTQ